MIPNSEFAVIKDAGHWPQWEKPEEFNEIQLTNFLLKNSEKVAQTKINEIGRDKEDRFIFITNSYSRISR